MGGGVTSLPPTAGFLAVHRPWWGHTHTHTRAMEAAFPQMSQVFPFPLSLTS